MIDNGSIPDALKRKMNSVNSILIMLQRTIDSADCCAYTREMSSVLDSAIDQMEECEELRALLFEEKEKCSAGPAGPLTSIAR